VGNTNKRRAVTLTLPTPNFNGLSIAMNKVIITDKIVRNLTPDTRSEFHLWDSQLPGFGVRKRQSGHSTWVLYYRPRNRKRIRKLTLGNAYAIEATEARRQARELLGQIAAGKDPADAKLAYRDASLRIAFNLFKSKHLPMVSREHARHRERIFERHFLPKLGDKVLNQISRTEIKEIIDRIAKKHKIAACNAHRGFSAFLSWCVEQGLIEHHVLRGSKLPAQYRARERVLTDAELLEVWNACDRLPQIWKTYFRMLIATGQRRSEVAAMHWNEISLEHRTWTLPPERTKNRYQHVVPISPLMIAILDGAPGRSGFVFPSPMARTQPIHSFGRATDALRKSAQVSGFRLHDLRRTAASIMGKIKIAPHVIEAILNHRSGIISGIAAIYNRYGYESEKEDGLCRYGDYLQALVHRPMLERKIDETLLSDAEAAFRFPRLAAAR
jgi:integrase